MKRKKFGQRPNLFPRQAVRQIGTLGASITPSGVRQQRRRIFVIAQVRPPGRTTPLGGKQRRILIFDNHPDSLRLVSKYHLYRDAERPSPRRSQRHVILALFLILFLIDAMFWP